MSYYSHVAPKDNREMHLNFTVITDPDSRRDTSKLYSYHGSVFVFKDSSISFLLDGPPYCHGVVIQNKVEVFTKPLCAGIGGVLGCLGIAQLSTKTLNITFQSWVVKLQRKKRCHYFLFHREHPLPMLGPLLEIVLSKQFLCLILIGLEEADVFINTIVSKSFMICSVLE